MQQPSSSLKIPSIVLFAGVGLISTIIDIFVLNLLLHFGVSQPIAVGLGFMAGLTNGFFMNSRFVFAKAWTSTRYLKYAAVSFGGFLWTELIVYMLSDLHKFLSLNKAKLVSVALVFFWNYILSKVWAFE